MLFSWDEIERKEDFFDDSGLRIRKAEYDFLEISASTNRNSVHMYPAMFHHKLVNAFVDIYTSKGDIVYDPFCGSGVALVECLKMGRNCIGSEVNPLALLISSVRCSNLDDKEYKILEYLCTDLKNNWKSLATDIPKVTNIDYWYSSKVTEELGKIRKWISAKIIDDSLTPKVKRILVLALSHIARFASYVRKREFKRYRMTKKNMENFYPDVLNEYIRTILKYGYILIKNKLPNDSNFKLIYQDLREGISIADESVDFVITSPPYGDSKTTVAYDEFSSFSLEWTNGLLGKVLKLDNNIIVQSKNELATKLLGSGKICQEVKSKALAETLAKIREKSIKRANDVKSFFADLSKTIRVVDKKLKEGGRACFVVGNRVVVGIPIPMDYIIKEIFESYGMIFEKILVRKIGNKRMPSKNSPTNKAGKTVNTMLYEYIVIIRK